MYAHVTDGVVDHMGGLPKRWGNISGLHLSNGDDVYLKTIGWLPLVETNVTPTRDQKFDTDVITIEADRVTLVHRVKDMTSEEQTERDEFHLEHLRDSRNNLLIVSDWTQAPDHTDPPSNAKKTEWATFRQSLRDLPATADMTKWPAITWPTDPDGNSYNGP